MIKYELHKFIMNDLWNKSLRKWINEGKRYNLFNQSLITSIIDFFLTGVLGAMWSFVRKFLDREHSINLKSEKSPTAQHTEMQAKWNVIVLGEYPCFWETKEKFQYFKNGKVFKNREGKPGSDIDYLEKGGGRVSWPMDIKGTTS